MNQGKKTHLASNEIVKMKMNFVEVEIVVLLLLMLVKVVVDDSTFPYTFVLFDYFEHQVVVADVAEGNYYYDYY